MGFEVDIQVSVVRLWFRASAVRFSVCAAVAGRVVLLFTMRILEP